MKTVEKSKINSVIEELKKISGHLKNKHESLDTDFYRDSLDFMVEENIRLMESMKKMHEEGVDFKRVA